jgi:hypothetical protein
MNPRKPQADPFARLAGVALAASLAIGVTDAPGQGLYRWTDEAGETHITNDPDQVPERLQPKPPPPEPRTNLRGAVASLRAIADLLSEDPAHEDYMTRMTEARQAVGGVLPGLDRGGLRAALTDALRCYSEAAELWDNQLKVRRSFDLPLNMTPIRRAWSCGVDKTGDAERLLGARR